MSGSHHDDDTNATDSGAGFGFVDFGFSIWSGGVSGTDRRKAQMNSRQESQLSFKYT